MARLACECAPMAVPSERLPPLGHLHRPPRKRSSRVISASTSCGALVFAAMCALGSCEPKLVVGERTCSMGGAGGAVPTTAPVSVPWSTRFENGFCDFEEAGGFCVSSGTGSHELVRSPVHSGEFSAAFSIDSADSDIQSRCVLQGELPRAAYYGAWYYVPALATTAGVWNLLHFQGGDPAGDQHGLWDVSLINGSDGSLQLAVYDFLRGQMRLQQDPRPIPIGSWFHLEFYLARATDATGEIALYQDGQLLVEATALVTDDTEWGQWYVGNLADGLTPSESTLYVDDVTIDSTR